MKEIAVGGNSGHEYGWKSCAGHIRAVIKGVLVIGFTLQSILGFFWM